MLYKKPLCIKPNNTLEKDLSSKCFDSYCRMVDKIM